MPAGRPPKPLERQIADSRGDGLRPGGHKMSTELMPLNARPVSVIPDPPEGLRERGSAEWASVWSAGRMWLHPAEDYHLVEMIARAYDDITAFRAEIENVGLIVKGYAGQQTANPLLREVRDAEATIRRCLSLLGFSPTDRARLGLAELKVRTGIQELQEKTQKARKGDD